MAMYDSSELEKRSEQFEIAKAIANLTSMQAWLEWTMIKTIYGLSDESYPAIADLIRTNLRCLDPSDPIHKLVYDNPMVKLGLIGRPMDERAE